MPEHHDTMPAFNHQSENTMSKNYTTITEAATLLPGFDRLDSHVIVQGLLYGIARIQSLPPERQERGSMIEMCAIVRKITSSTDDRSLATMLWGVEHHVGHEVDLWPAGSGRYSDAEFEREDGVRNLINVWKARFEQSGALADAPPADVIKFIGGLPA